MKQYQNIKYPFDFAQGKQILKLIYVVGIFTFLSLNIISSQLISPYFFGFANNDRTATVSFLQKIKNLPEYQKILEINNNIYGQTVKEVIFKQENRKKEMINNLEQKLTINPKARDILYSLYQLYLADGDKNRANDYLRRAREVDPDIN